MKMDSTFSEIARHILEDNIYLALATTSSSGKPWITPLFYAYDRVYQFYWSSAKESRHSKNILLSRDAAATVFDSQKPWGVGNAVFMEGQAREASEEEVPTILEVLYSRTHPLLKERTKRTKEAYVGDSPRRLYVFTPKHVFIIDPNGHPVYGHLVSVRAEVDLALP